MRQKSACNIHNFADSYNNFNSEALFIFLFSIVYVTMYALSLVYRLKRLKVCLFLYILDYKIMGFSTATKWTKNHLLNSIFPCWFFLFFAFSSCRSESWKKKINQMRSLRREKSTLFLFNLKGNLKKITHSCLVWIEYES